MDLIIQLRELLSMIIIESDTDICTIITFRSGVLPAQNEQRPRPQSAKLTGRPGLNTAPTPPSVLDSWFKDWEVFDQLYVNIC